MCSKHDDPSMHDMPRQLDAEEAYAMAFYARNDHEVWMRQNDPNTWAWLLPRNVRLEKYSEAVHGANQMRSLAYAKVVEPVDWWEASKNNYNGGFNSFEEAVEYYK